MRWVTLPSQQDSGPGGGEAWLSASFFLVGGGGVDLNRKLFFFLRENEADFFVWGGRVGNEPEGELKKMVRSSSCSS